MKDTPSPNCKAPPERKQREGAEPCSRCSGTGLVCGQAPVIDANNCCVDYANAICPQCGGAGVEKKPAES